MPAEQQAVSMVNHQSLHEFPMDLHRGSSLGAYLPVRYAEGTGAMLQQRPQTDHDFGHLLVSVNHASSCHADHQRVQTLAATQQWRFTWEVQLLFHPSKGPPA
jgi:hypothetical protein